MSDHPPYRIGQGYDTHRLLPGIPLIVGGITIPHDRGAVGHSDADVLLHGLTDALLGAIAAGDIGELFPDTDPFFRGQDSALFVQRAVELVQQAGWGIGNVDATVFSQKPKLSAYKRPMAVQIAKLLQIDSVQVNIKAKTGEAVGPIGREEAISSSVTVLLYRNETTVTGEA